VVLASHAEKKDINLKIAPRKALGRRKKNQRILPSMGDQPPPSQMEELWTNIKSF